MWKIQSLMVCLLSAEGLIRLEYDDEPLLPQIERWHIVGVSPWPQPQWMFVMW